MFDFFDEDFPLTKKQEEEYKKRLADEAEALERLAMNIAEEASESAEIVKPDESIPSQSPAQAAEDVVIDNLPAELFDNSDDDEDNDEESQAEPTAGEAYAQQLAEIMGDSAAVTDEQTEEIGGETDDGELCGDEKIESVEPVPEMSPYNEMFDGEADDGELSDDSSEYGEPDEQPAPDESEPAEPADEAVPTYEAEAEFTEEPIPENETEAEEDSVMPTPADFDLSEDDFAVSPEALAFDDSLASINALEQHLREELRSLGEKLESMERVVDNMEDGEIAEGFDYEYDERYFAVEETPAYQHPEMCKAAHDDERYDDEFEERADRFDTLSEQFEAVAEQLEAVAEQPAAAKEQPMEIDEQPAAAEPTAEEPTTDEPVCEPAPEVEPAVEALPVEDIQPAQPAQPAESVESVKSVKSVEPLPDPEIAPPSEKASGRRIEKPARRPVKTAPAKAKGSDININISSTALIKTGAAVAAAALAYKLMGGRSNGKGKK